MAEKDPPPLMTLAERLTLAFLRVKPLPPSNNPIQLLMRLPFRFRQTGGFSPHYLHPIKDLPGRAPCFTH